VLSNGLFGKISFPNDYMTGDRIKRTCDVAVEMGHNPSHMRSACQAKTVFIKTDYVEGSFEAMRNGRQKPCVIVTHNSDLRVTERLWYKKPDTVQKWYAINVVTRQYGLIPIPLGTENMRSPGYSGNMGVIERILATRTRDYQNLAYVNFNPKTNPDEREPILDLHAGKSWVTHVGYGNSFEQTMRDTRSHKFVFAPPGNGMDTHRMWESVYLGTIPIVKRSVHTEAFQDLPILIVDQWDEVTRDMLETVWNDYSRREWNMEKATLRYWRQRVRSWDGEFSKEQMR
jgi:hypothetical protein